MKLLSFANLSLLVMREILSQHLQMLCKYAQKVTTVIGASRNVSPVKTVSFVRRVEILELIMVALRVLIASLVFNTSAHLDTMD